MDETKNIDAEEAEEAEEINEKDLDETESEEETKKEVSFGKKLIAKDTFRFSVRDICEMAIFCALAIVFDTFCKIDVGFEGGSINFAMFPLFIIALRQGWFKGFIAGAFVFGIITCILDEDGKLAVYFLDYFVAFGSVGILGVLKPVITDDYYNVTWHSYAFSAVGIVAAYIVRFFAATLDGMLFYGADLLGSIIYNAPYIFASMIIVLALFLGLLVIILKTFRTHNTKSL